MRGMCFILLAVCGFLLRCLLQHTSQLTGFVVPRAGKQSLRLDGSHAPPPPAAAAPAEAGSPGAVLVAAAFAGISAAVARGRKPHRRCLRAEPEWRPRNSSWSPADLAQKRQEVEALPGADAGYTGPHYEGPDSLSAAFINQMLAFYQQGGALPKKYAYRIVLDVIDVLGRESSLRELTVPAGADMKIVGDLHGQFWDFLTVMGITGMPSKTSPVIFNGDFVDRGSWGIEVITTIFAMKIMEPESVGLNRGNHEMLEANIIYGFLGECSAKYDEGLFDLFSEAFRRLPLAQLIDKKVLVVHGGLPGPDPRIWMPGQTHDPTDAIPMMGEPTKLSALASIDREFEIGPDQYKESIGPHSDDKQVNDERFLIDLLWSDPRGGVGYGPSYRKAKGVYMFGPDVTEAFCKANSLQCVIRSHEVKADGYRWDHPQLCTVFSAPNYLDTGNNKGAVLKVSHPAGSDQLKIDAENFVAAPHPDVEPMHWQSIVTERHPHLLRKMRKKGETTFDEFGDSDFAGMGLMNFDEWEPDEADQFQEAFKVDEFGRDLE